MQLGAYDSVVLSTSTLQNDASTKGQRSRTPRLLQQLPQRYFLLWTHNQFPLLRTSSWIRHNPR